MYDRECIIDNPYYVHDEITEEDCSVCRKLRKIKRDSNVSQSTIADDYLFSNVPVIVTDAMEEWDALEKFDISFLAEVRSDCKSIQAISDSSHQSLSQFKQHEVTRSISTLSPPPRMGC